VRPPPSVPVKVDKKVEAGASDATPLLDPTGTPNSETFQNGDVEAGETTKSTLNAQDKRSLIVSFVTLLLSIPALIGA